MQVEEIKKAAADVLSQIAATNQPANEILNAYTRTRRYIVKRPPPVGRFGLGRFAPSRPVGMGSSQNAVH